MTRRLLSTLAFRRAWRGACLIGLMLSLAQGCALIAKESRDEPPVEPSAARSILAYYDWLEGAPRVAVLREAARLMADSGALDSDLRDLRLALLWSVSVLATEDSVAAARSVLAGLPARGAAEQEAAEYLVFARIWRAQLLLRDNLKAANAALAQIEASRREAEQGRRALRQELEALLADSAGKGERIQLLEARIETLSAQIDALTHIEQQLVEREQEQIQGP